MYLLWTKPFHRWMQREALNAADLRITALEISEGLVDAKLGAGLFKKRIALAGRGKRGGGRSIVAYRQGDRIIFLTGFSKNERADISPAELEALKLLGRCLLTLSIEDIQSALAAGQLQEGEPL